MKHVTLQKAVKLNEMQITLESAIGNLKDFDKPSNRTNFAANIACLKEIDPKFIVQLESFLYEQIGIIVDEIEKL